MKKQIPIVLLILIFSLVSVFALECGFESPTPITTTGTVGNQSMLNASYSNAGITEPLINMTFSASSVSTRNSSTSLLGNSSNVTQVSGGQMAPNSVNLTISNAVLIDDSNNYIISCSCGNSTTSVACNSTRTVTFDRTKPSPPTGITFTNPVLEGNTIRATINRELANRCWIHFGGQTTERRAMTLSGSTCTFTAQKDSPSNSDYETFIEADDRTNTTFATSVFITIRASQSDGGGILSGATIQLPASQGGQSLLGGGSSNNPFAPKGKNNTGMIVIAIIALLIYLRNKK